MARVFLYSPHPDDETLSMGLAMLYYIANGVDVHLVSVTDGAAIGVAEYLNGTRGGCSVPVDHPYTHSPSREGFPVLTATDIGTARLQEARSVLGTAAMVPPVAATPGAVYHHLGGLPAEFGGPAHSPPTVEAVAAAKVVIKSYVDAYPNSFHHTMSDAESLVGMAADGGPGHADHAACGLALRELKQSTDVAPGTDGLTYAQALGGSRFFVSRLYWAISRPDKTYPAPLLDVANGTLAWFNTGTQYTALTNWLRGPVIKPYKAWNPTAGAYGVGWHQVPSQFNNNFATGVSIANLWHA